MRVFSIISAVLAASIAQAGVIILPPTIHTVGAGGTCDFATIQAAINAADDDDIIAIARDQVYNNQQLFVTNKSLEFRGGFDDCGDGSPGALDTLVNGNGSASVFSITSNEVDPAEVSFANIAIWGGGGSDGGGLHISGNVEVVVAAGSVSNNDVSGSGGGIFLSGADASVVIGDNAIIGSTSAVLVNSAVSGGGIFCENGKVQFESVDLVGNTAQVGAGIYGESCTISNIAPQGGGDRPVRIRDNEATGFGGGMYLVEDSLVGLGRFPNQLVEISNNSGSHGGGAFVSNSIVFAAGVEVTGNHADQSGGGFNLDSAAELRMDRVSDEDVCGQKLRCSLLTDNSAGISGGALTVLSGSEAKVQQTFVENNDAGNGPLAIVDGADSALYMSSVVVRYHDPDDAIYNIEATNSAEVGIAYATFVDNGVRPLRLMSNSTGHLFNSILIGNFGGDIFEGAGTTLLSGCNNTHQPTNFNSEVHPAGFEDAAEVTGAGLMLADDSQNLDRCANPNAGFFEIFFDIAGNDRIYDDPNVPNDPAAADRGAFERGDLIFADGLGD